MIGEVAIEFEEHRDEIEIQAGVSLRFGLDATYCLAVTFEEQLDADHEVGMGFAGGDMGMLHIQGVGFFDPDIVTFYGVDGAGAKTQLIQHVSQLSVMLKAAPKVQETAARIGFELAAKLGED